MRVGVISRTDTEAAFPVTRRVIEILNKKGANVRVETETSLALSLPDGSIDLADMDVDFIVAIGGDGTILRTAMNIGIPEIPLLGVNMGRRGFLCEIFKEDIEIAIERALKGDYELESCHKLSSKSRQLTDAFPDALNEVLIASSLPSKMLLLNLSVDGQKITEIQADSILISTPTGSTAYNLSAGGSILSPGVDAMIITAVNPYSYFRSITLPLNTKVTVDLLKPRTDALAIIDGKVYTGLKPHSTIDIWVSEHKTRFIRFKPFYSRLKARISHLQAQ